jgi:hypothetical protein
MRIARSIFYKMLKPREWAPPGDGCCDGHHSRTPGSPKHFINTPPGYSTSVAAKVVSPKEATPNGF